MFAWLVSSHVTPVQTKVPPIVLNAFSFSMPVLLMTLVNALSVPKMNANNVALPISVITVSKDTLLI